MKGINIFNYEFIRNEAAGTATINVDGNIVDEPTRQLLQDWYGDETSVSFKSLRTQMLNCGVKNIDVNINSGGGHVGDAMAMHDLIHDMNTNKGYSINTHVKGIAASAATYLAMAGKKCTMSDNSWLMIHNVTGYVYGNVNEIENYARSMRKFNDCVVNFYVGKTKQTAEQVSKWMNEETWFTAAEAEQYGFIQKATTAETFTNSIKKEHWPYQNMAVLNMYNSFISPEQGANQISIMDLSKFKNDILDSIKNLFPTNGGIKPEDQATGIANAVSKAFENIQNEWETSVVNKVNESLKGDSFKNAVSAAVATELSNLKTVPENITNAIAEATKPFAKVEDLNKVVNDLGDKLAGGNKNTHTPENKGNGLGDMGIKWG